MASFCFRLSDNFHDRVEIQQEYKWKISKIQQNSQDNSTSTQMQDQMKYQNAIKEG
jgi:hypothetical protein